MNMDQAMVELDAEEFEGLLAHIVTVEGERDALRAERDALHARVAVYETNGAGVVPVNGGRCFEVYQDGQMVDLETSEAGEEIRQLRARVAELEAPPVVPAGWTIEKRDDMGGLRTWGAISEDGTHRLYQLPCGDIVRSSGFIAVAVLPALCWAIEHDARPPHADDKGEP